MKRCLLLSLIVFSLASCDFNKEEKAKLDAQIQREELVLKNTEWMAKRLEFSTSKHMIPMFLGRADSVRTILDKLKEQRSKL